MTVFFPAFLVYLSLGLCFIIIPGQVFSDTIVFFDSHFVYPFFHINLVTILIMLHNIFLKLLMIVGTMF